MKAWFARVRISVALKAGPRPSGSLQQTMNSSEQAGDLEQEMMALDRALKETAPKRQAPPSLHRSIMLAVRAAKRPSAAPRGLSFLKWFPAPALVALALLVAWHVQRGPVRPPTPDPQSLAAATTALEMGGQMAQAMPSAVVAPLADELARLNRDLNNTAQFLLASLP
jgi:hypothetical protein